MKKKLLVLILSAVTAFSFIFAAGCEQFNITTDFEGLAARNAKRGTYMAISTYDLFYDEEGEFAYRNLPTNIIEESWISDCWRYTGLFSMMIRCNELNDKAYTDQMNHLVAGFDYYKGTRNDNSLNGVDPVTGFGIGREFTVFAVNRANRPNRADAFGTLSVFDDQIWIAREYYNAYMLYGNKEYLDTAIELAEYIYLVGWTPTVGGITWGQDYQTRHSCSNAPFVKVLVNLSVAANRPEMLDWAKNVYNFTYNTLRDPSDNLYYDLVGTIYDEHGNPIANEPLNDNNKTKYTYNSGAMISAGVSLYEATGEQHYLDEAKATAEGCYEYFGNRDFLEGYVMYPTATTTWFNLVMYIGYYDLFMADNTQTKYLDEVQASIDYAYENFGVDGFIPVSWLVGWESGWAKSDAKNLLDHSSHAETYLLLAQYQSVRQSLT